MALLPALKHHAAVAKAAWSEQRALEKSLKAESPAQRAELAFLPAALEITETPARPLGRAMMMAICAFFAIAIGWAAIGEMDIIATAQGKIIPTERVKKIQPLETGEIRAIHVKDGQHVEKGETLVELNPTGSEADQARLIQDLSARAELARLQALLADDPENAFSPPEDAPDTMVRLHRAYLRSELQKRAAERASLTGEIERREAEVKTLTAGVGRLERKLTKVRERVEGRRKLMEKGIIAKLEFNELEEELFDVEDQLEVERKRLTETVPSLRAAKAQLAQAEAEFRSDVLARETETRDRVKTIEQELIKEVERFRLQTLKAPVSGTVQRLDIHTIGGIVQPAQVLMEIVPDSSIIEVEAMVLNKDKGFVFADQEVELKVESFPFTKYGTIPGSVRLIYEDAIPDEQQGSVYPARITMARTTIAVGKGEVDLKPGMTVTAEIKTGKRKIIEYILAPLQEYVDESMREQ